MARDATSRARSTVLLRQLGLPWAWLKGTTLCEARPFRLRIRRADLAEAVRVDLVPNRVGGVYLDVVDRAGRRAGCHLLIIGRGGVRYVPAAALDLLSAALHRSPAGMAPAVCAMLDEQARHLRRGWGAAHSPLRRHTEWNVSGQGEPEQEVPRPRSRNPFETVRRDDPAGPRDGLR